MTESEESVSLKDRYESLKLLCSEQVLANELLKEELERLRKGFNEISRHRAFLLEKVIALQSKPSQGTLQESKKSGKSSAVQNHMARNNHSQRSKTVSSDRRPPMQRPKVYHGDAPSFDESDAESESVHGDFDNGWEDDFPHMGIPSYRRSQTKGMKRQPKLPQVHQQTSFKRSRVIEEDPGPSSRSNFVGFSPPGPSHTSMPGVRTAMPYETPDMSEEPPIIYSKSAGYPLNEVPRRSNPSIIRNSSLVGGNANERSYTQNTPSVSGNYYGPRIN